MHSPIIQSQSVDATDNYIHILSVAAEADYVLSSDELLSSVTEPTRFHSTFTDQMDLYADAQTVAAYFDNHSVWFERCAQPMKVELIDRNAYALTVGRYGAAGFELEPRIGLNLLPQEDRVYRIETVPVPGYEPVGYQVDFKASMALIEASRDELAPLDKITCVNWCLDLTVDIQFPRFIYAALPKSLIMGTGEQLLKQVVRQVSRRLTRKVQEDFCRTHDITMPKRQRRWFFHREDANPETSD